MDRSGAAKPFTRNRFHYNWHWQWDYGNGDIGNQGAHQIHAARMALGVKYPTQISSMGGHFMFDDDQETPNTQVATFEFDDARQEEAAGVRGAPLDDQQRGGHRRTVRRAGRRRGRASSRRSATSGTGRRAIWRRAAGGWQTFIGPEQAPGPKSEAGAGVGGFVNFIDVVRSRKREDQLSEIEEGAISTMLIHLANISYRTGRTLYFDPVNLQLQG